MTGSAPESSGILANFRMGNYTIAELISNFRSGRLRFLPPSSPLFVCALFLGSTLGGPHLRAQEKLTPKQVDAIRELGAGTLTKEGPPGLAVAVSKGDQVWSAGFGSADLEQNVAYKPPLLPAKKAMGEGGAMLRP